MLLINQFIKFAFIVIISWLLVLTNLSNIPIESFEEKENAGFEIFIYFLLGTIIIFIVIKYLKFAFLLNISEFFILFASSYLITFFLFPSFIISFIIASLLTFARALNLLTNELSAIISSIGTSMVLGILIPLKPLIIFTFLLCFYDIFSVFITKHMMEFVKYAKEQNAAMLIETKEVVYKKGKKIETSIAMGTGDIVIPSAVSISALSISVNTAFSFLVASLFGYWVVIIALYALKRPLPALPFVMLPQFIVFLNYFVL